MNSAELDNKPLPTGWICRESKSRHQRYYFNKVTGESSWKHPLDVDLLLHSTGGVLKRGVEDGESSTSSKKKKKSKNKKRKKSPGKSNDSHISPEHSSPNSHNKMPQMRTSAVNTNGQKLLCTNTKVRRISAWVDSVDHSYTPSEQGTCVSSPTHSLDASNDFFPFTPSREPSETNSRPAKQLHKRDVYTDKSNNNMNNHSRHPSSFSQKGSIASDISATGEKKSEKRKNSSSTSGNHHAPFTPLSPQSSVTGVNSAKTNPRQELPNAATAYPAQSIEAMQLDSQLPLEDFVNNHNNVGQDRTQFADDSEIAMEIDNYEELADQIKLELQGIRSEFVIDPSKVVEDSSRHSAVSYSDTLYLVLDTNVLLSHLKLISELKDFPIEGVARPVLVVPWIVIQELDSLKSDSWKIRKGKFVTNQKQSQNGKFGVDTLARQAVRFLHTCFESSHPRVRGQTLSEAQEMMENCSIEDPSNDDKILECCLLFQRKADKGHAVLFSNDQNLCSKAIINGLKAFNHQSLVSGLKELFQSSAVVLKQDYFKDYYKELKHQETLAEKRAKADDLICELQCIMREGLAVVVETEMRAAYDDLWDKIVFIKPPWTLADLLQLLDKHWIAVFGQVFKRNIKSTVEDLRKHFSGSGVSPGCLIMASNILNQGHTLFEAIAARSSYNGAITKCVTAIIVLKRKCKEYQQDGDEEQTARSQSSVVMGPPQVPALVGPGTRDSSRSSSNETEQENSSGRCEEGSEVGSSVDEINTAQAGTPHALVLSAFETIWNAVCQFSAQIYCGVGFPHPIPPDVLEGLTKPTREEAIQFLGRLSSCLALVVTAIQSVLQEPIGNETGNFQSFETLLQAIVQFFNQVLSMSTNVTVADLVRFARDPNARMGLIQGCSQLDRALATLQQCSRWVASTVVSGKVSW